MEEKYNFAKHEIKIQEKYSGISCCCLSIVSIHIQYCTNMLFIQYMHHLLKEAKNKEKRLLIHFIKKDFVISISWTGTSIDRKINTFVHTLQKELNFTTVI